MPTARVLTPWTGTGEDENMFRPLLLDRFPGITFSDVTGQPPENLHPNPNLYLVEVRAPSDTLDQIEANANFHIIFRDDQRRQGELMTEPEFSLLRTFLASAGVTNPQLDSHIGTSVRGRLRHQMATDTARFLKSIPKAVTAQL